MIRVAMTLLCLAYVMPSIAQDPTTPYSSRSQPGGTIPNRAVSSPTFGPRAGSDILRHRDFTGKPCLTVTGSTRAHFKIPNLYDHVINVSNACPQRITIRVCYFRTENCIPMEIPGSENKQALLGAMPSAQEFGFEFREKFQ
jgi:hypothetical protein